MQPLAGRRILLAEDEPLIALLLAEALAEAGAVVLGPADSPAAALALLAAPGPEAALLDLRLAGGATAAPLAHALAAAGIPFALMSGAAGDAPLPAHPAAPVLHKPFALEAAVALLARILARG